MKRVWITESGIVHHRKPKMDATEYVEVKPINLEDLKRESYDNSNYVAGNKYLGQTTLTMAGIITETIDYLASRYYFVERAEQKAGE